jgi:hypothetical protein
VSLLCSATREAIASLFQTRAKVLLDGVLTMLHEPAGQPRCAACGRRCCACSARGRLRLDKLDDKSLTAQVMRHPLITGMAQQGACRPTFRRRFLRGRSCRR